MMQRGTPQYDEHVRRQAAALLPLTPKQVTKLTTYLNPPNITPTRTIRKAPPKRKPGKASGKTA
jgi:hypothetical protein